MVGDFLEAEVGNVDDQDMVVGGGIDIDVVIPDTATDNRLQPGQVLKNAAGKCRSCTVKTTSASLAFAIISSSPAASMSISSIPALRITSASSDRGAAIAALSTRAIMGLFFPEMLSSLSQNK